MGTLEGTHVEPTIEIPESMKVLFFNDETEDTKTFVEKAVAKFAELHLVYPDAIILNIWRRLTLTSAQWHGFHHGPIFIPLLSPHEAPDVFKDYAIPKNTAICISNKDKDDIPTQ